MRNTSLIVAAVAVLAIGFLLVQGSDDDGTPTSVGNATVQETAAPAATAPSVSAEAPASKPKPQIPTVVFAGGKPQGGVRKLTFSKGDDVRFRVRSDVAEEIHVHGFDKMADVAAGGTVSFNFPAKFDGAYEVEMEGSGTQVASLEIQP